MRVMAIDYGDARTGVALSDATGFLAGRTFLIKSRKEDVVLAELVSLAQKEGAQELVMGYPRNMDGTLDAHRILGEQGVRAKNRKDKIDSVAATLILEGYLDWKRLQAQRQEKEGQTP